MTSTEAGNTARHQYSEHSISSSRRYIGFALGHDPVQLVADAGNPSWSAMPARVVKHISDQAADLEIWGSSMLLQNGIDDTQKILRRSIEARSVSEALRFSSHPRTIESVARIALRSHTELGQMLKGMYHPVTRAQSGDYHPAEGVEPVGPFGCPFAEHESDTDISPLFRRFIPWAAALTIESLRRHGKIS